MYACQWYVLLSGFLSQVFEHTHKTEIQCWMSLISLGGYMKFSAGKDIFVVIDLIHLKQSVLPIIKLIDHVISGLRCLPGVNLFHLSPTIPMWPILPHQHTLHDLFANVG